MKTLWLVRHAKSSRDDPALADRDRPLAPRGERDVVTMGRRLNERQVRPQRIVSSPALRARTTAEAIAGQLGGDAVQIAERLYACPTDELFAFVRALDDRLDEVMLVGHNPEMGELAHRLAPEINEMPTCAVAEFGFEVVSWSAVDRPARVVMDYPKKS